MALVDGAAPPRLLLAPGPCSSSSKGDFLTLCHPKSGEEACYVLLDSLLYELNWFKQAYGSCFLGDYVSEDGGLYFCTPVDPVFVLLPLFDTARMSNSSNPGMFRQLEEILYVEGYPGYQQLMPIAETHMKIVCEVREAAGSIFFRLDNVKLLAWLCCKVQHLKEVIPKLGQNYAAREEKEILKDAVQMLCEYLKAETWLPSLCKQLHLNIEEISGASVPGAASVCREDILMQPLPFEKSANGNGNSRSAKGKQTKKQKTVQEAGSQNIRDMFRRVTRSGK